jgi:hypothetical protein
MAGQHLVAYILGPNLLAFCVADASAGVKLSVPAVMVIEGACRCCTQVLPFLSRFHRCLTFLCTLAFS